MHWHEWIATSMRQQRYLGLELVIFSPATKFLGKGRPRLKKALAVMYSPSFGRQLDPETEITITTGANEGFSHPRSPFASTFLKI
jgi:hypothetical protein